MHDDRVLIEAPLERVLRERIRPAVHGTDVPLDVEVWHAPGEPVAGRRRRCAAPYRPVAGGRARGARPGAPAGSTSPGPCPAAWAGRTGRGGPRPRLRTGPCPASSARAWSTAPTAPRSRASTRATTWVRVADRAEGGEQVELLRRGRGQPASSTTPLAPTQLGDKAHRRRPTRSTGSRRMDLAVFDDEVWELVQDLEVLGELMRELPVERRPALGASCAPSSARWTSLDLQDVAGTAAAARARARAGVLATPAVAVRAPDQRRRPRAHRLGLAVAAARDRPQGGPHRVQRDRADGRRPGLRLRHVAGAAVRLDQGAPARGLRAGRRRRSPTGSSCRSAACGSSPTPTCPAARRWPASSCTASGSSSTSSASRPRRCGCPTPSATPPRCRRSSSCPGRKWFLTQKISWNQTNKFPHHTFWWEGIDGTRVFTHFPPVDTYNCRPERRASWRTPARNFKDKGVAHALARARSAGATAAAAPPARCWPGRRRLRDLEGSPRVDGRDARRRSSPRREAEYPDAAGLGRRALPGAAPRHAHLPGQDQAGQPAQRAPAARGRAVGGHRGRARRLRLPVRASWTGSGRRCCCTSSTTSCPGSSIAWVHREAERPTRAVRGGARRRSSAPRSGPWPATATAASVVFNAAPHARGGVPGRRRRAVAAGGARRR